MITLVKIYRAVLSPWLLPSCRFHPTCSVYAEQAFEHYGVIKGFVFILHRIGRCHPFHSGGHDPLPLQRNRYGN